MHLGGSERERERGGGVKEDQLKLLRATNVGNVKLDETQINWDLQIKTGSQREAWIWDEKPLDLNVSTTAGTFDAVVPSPRLKSVFLPPAHAWRTRAEHLETVSLRVCGAAWQ